MHSHITTEQQSQCSTPLVDIEIGRRSRLLQSDLPPLNFDRESVVIQPLLRQASDQKLLRQILTESLTALDKVPLVYDISPKGRIAVADALLSFSPHAS